MRIHAILCTAITLLVAISIAPIHAAVTVVSTFPANGATDVDASTDKLRIRFSDSVSPDGYSLVNTDDGEPIQFAERPVIQEANKLWVFPMKLRPGVTYAVSINSPSFRNFRSAKDPKVSVTPYLLTFTTSGRQAEGVSEPQGWRQDLAFLAKELPARHVNLFARITKEQWKTAVSDLDKQLPGMSQSEIVAGLLKLVASVGDQHTALNIFKHPYVTRLPIVMYWFKDGVYVVAASDDYKDALGCRIDGIGTMDIDQACKAMSVMTARTNDSELKNEAPAFLAIPQLLHALKITQDADKVPLRLTTPDGKSLTLDLKPVRLDAQVKMISAVDSLKFPLYLAKQDVPHWARYLDKENVVYFHYNQCVDNDKCMFSATRQTVELLMKEHRDAPLVIDMRNNGGGNSVILDPFIDWLKTQPVNKTGRLFVIIGRRTFSSAILNATRLRNSTKAVLIGEPTSGSPNHYGEVKTFDLPSSKFAVSYSTKYFRYSRHDTPTLSPTVLVELTSKDFLTATDPVLDAVLKYKP